MSDYIIHSDGGDDYREQAPVYEIIPGQGGKTTRNFQGGYASLKSLAVTLYAQNYAVTFTDATTPDAPHAVCTLQAVKNDNIILAAQDNPPVPVWEIKKLPIERNILEATDLPIVQNLSTATKQRIEYRIKNPLSTITLTPFAEYSSSFDNAFKVYNLMRVGIETKQDWLVSVTRTIVVPNQYTPTWNLDFVDYVISKDRLVIEFGVPDYLSDILPESDSAIVNDFNNIPTFKGYLVQQPEYVTTANNRVQVQQEFSYNKWVAGPLGLYDVKM